MPIDKEAYRFIEAFDYVVDKTNDDPNSLAVLAQSDPKVKDAVDTINRLRHFAGFEDDAKGKFARDVSNSFLKRWNVFKQRWEDSFFRLDPLYEIISKMERTDDACENVEAWDVADSYASDKADKIRQLFSFLSHLIESIDDDDYRDEIYDGVVNLEKLLLVGNLIPTRFFRRYDMLPFIHVPQHVSKDHGDEGEFRSLYNYLRESQIAFAFGLNRAAHAVLRALLELVLSKHYGIPVRVESGKTRNKTLGNKLESFRMKYGDRAWFDTVWNELKNIKEKGDLILHIEKPSAFSCKNVKLFETEFVSLFQALKYLVENAESNKAGFQ